MVVTKFESVLTYKNDVIFDQGEIIEHLQCSQLTAGINKEIKD